MEKMNSSNLERSLIREQLITFLKEDIRYGDVSSKLVNNNNVTANIIAKSAGICCGVEEFLILCDIAHVNATPLIQDGTRVEKGTIILNLKGQLHDILGIERTALNIMMRMSAIATSTSVYTEKIKLIQKKNSFLDVKVAATRKTTPGFRYFEKKAVMIGGGDPHRWCLDDMVMLKDTHLDAAKMNIYQMLEFAREHTSFSKKIEIEVEKSEDAIIAFESKADIIMFDNMTPESIKSTIITIKKIGEEKNLSLPIFEASGNISLNNFEEYVKSGVNIISTSEITMFPPKRLDVSLKIQ